VSSPNDRVDELEEKAEQFLAAGVRRVWIVNPETRTVRILRPDGSDTRLHEDDELTGEDVLPGFSCKVSELFPKQAGSNRS
jgi:Uma2 family endonuclease